MKSSIRTAATIAYSLTLWVIALSTSFLRFTRPYAVRVFWAIATAGIYAAVFFARFVMPKILLIFFIAGCRILEIALSWIRKNSRANFNYFPEPLEDTIATEIPEPIEAIVPTPQLPAVSEPTPAIAPTPAVPKKTKAKTTPAPTAAPKRGRGRPKKVSAAA